MPVMAGRPWLLCPGFTRGLGLQKSGIIPLSPPTSDRLGASLNRVDDHGPRWFGQKPPHIHSVSTLRPPHARFDGGAVAATKTPPGWSGMVRRNRVSEPVLGAVAVCPLAAWGRCPSINLSNTMYLWVVYAQPCPGYKSMGFVRLLLGRALVLVYLVMRRPLKINRFCLFWLPFQLRLAALHLVRP